ncbi:hypothetical protein Y032_0159g3277 [Ancylostoma ceylanicum]|uniref:Uncharacterized protein n=1 Tax=Ancylostoma ceylanicum TaxID=53326 RepID=A0A016SYE1_9BILA|nr:hypothetical protein Y032_0159g3277 [Ancylostoma ceylanicum]
MVCTTTIADLLPFLQQEFNSAALEFGELRGKEGGRVALEIIDIGKSVGIRLEAFGTSHEIPLEQYPQTFDVLGSTGENPSSITHNSNEKERHD